MKRSEDAQQEMNDRSSTSKSVVDLDRSNSNTILYATRSGIERFLQSTEITA